MKNSVGSTTLSQYDYANDAGGRRTSVKHSGSAFETGAAFNLYGYNSRSEVQTADRYWGANLNDTSDPVDGQSFAYGYDNIGNRTSSLRENEEMDYTANNLNQYAQRTIPDGIDVLGSAETNSTVTVNNSAVTRHGKYWHKALTVTNDGSAAYQDVSVVGVYNPPGTNDPDVITTETGRVFVAKTPEAFTYDDDGNLLSDGRFNYSWDAENRLIVAETLSTLPSSVPRVKLEFAYDYMSRRVSKQVSNIVSAQWSVVSSHAFLYDGWNLVSEICNNESQITTNTYVHGVDLSGSLQGAGGIGGLLSATIGTNSVVYSYDANGNVSELISANGTVVGHYEYSPFGETIVATGPLAKNNSYRFSTKYTDDETASLYYGYRYYSPSLGRWPARDPIDEKGGINYYGFVLNNPVLFIDPNGECAAVWLYETEPVWGPWIKTGLVLIGGMVYQEFQRTGVFDQIWQEFKDLCDKCVKAGTKAIPDTKTETKTESKTCPPCPAPPPPYSRTDTSHSHYPCPGAHTHNYVPEYNQEPYPSCTCHQKDREVGVDCL